jgi:hypothetical protein
MTRGERISLLTAAPDSAPERHPGSEHDTQPAGQEASHHK